jgi:hypothetical protein
MKENHFKETTFLFLKGIPMTRLSLKLWTDDTGQDIAEYAVVLAVILVLVVGTIRLITSYRQRCVRLKYRPRGREPYTAISTTHVAETPNPPAQSRAIRHPVC